MKRKIIIGLLMIILVFSLFGCATEFGSTAEDKVSQAPVKELYNDDVFEFIDSDTGVHYWVYSHKGGNGGMGGITPRLNSDGSIMVD